jgi:hypothetical protein
LFKDSVEQLASHALMLSMAYPVPGWKAPAETGTGTGTGKPEACRHLLIGEDNHKTIE